MQYTYDLMINEGPTDRRRETTTNFREVNEGDCLFPHWVSITDNVTGFRNSLSSEEDYEMWCSKLEKEFAWKPHKAWDPLDEEETDIIKADKAEVMDIMKSVLNVKFSPEDNVDPQHYKNFVDEYEWIEVMARIPRYRDNPEIFKGALELQIRKYLDRNGRKDEELQELQKGQVYYMYLVEYIKNGNRPPDIKEVHRRLR
jgi:hypothetical protein